MPNSCSDRTSIYADCIAERDRFLALVNKYLVKRGQEPLRLQQVGDQDQLVTWEKVESTLSTACSSIEKLAFADDEARGFAARMRRGYHKLCDHASDARGFLSLIPSDFMGSSVLCGGLTVIFRAMEQVGYQRIAVYHALEELPVILNDKIAGLKVYEDDEELHRRMATLYVAVLAVLRCILEWFARSALR